MKKKKKIFMLLFTMVASLFVVNNVNALDYFYDIEIDETGKMTATKTLSDGTVEAVTMKQEDPYIVEDGSIVYNTETDKLTIKEGTIIGSIKSEDNLTIYTDNKEVFINYIVVGNDSVLEIIDSKVSFSELPNTTLKEYSSSYINISNSELDVPSVQIIGYQDLFVDSSKIKSLNLWGRGSVLKITDSKVEATGMTGGATWGNTAQGMDWLSPDDYKFMGDNGRAYYGVLIVDSDVTLVGGSQGQIFSRRGILIKDSKIKDNSTLSQKGYIKAGTHMNLVIKDSNVVTDASIGTSVFSPYPGGDLTITNSTVSSKATVLSNDETHSSSAIVADGNLTISNSKVIADASATNGAIVAIAYSGSLNYDNSAIIIDENGNELIKDIDISDIKYNKNFISAVKNIYTIGLKNSDGTLSGVDSDYAIIGNAYNVTVSISGGTWSDGTTEDKVIKILYGETLTEEDLPTGMKSTIGTTTGSWSESLPLTLTSDMKLVYTFDIENPNTVDSIFGCFAALIVSLVGIYVTINLRKKIIVK